MKALIEQDWKVIDNITDTIGWYDIIFKIIIKDNQTKS